MTEDLPRTWKVVTVWLLVGLAVFLTFQAWERQRNAARFQAEGDVVEIRRGDDGHFHWPGSINGRAVDFLVDTGATGVAISQELARSLDLASTGKVRSSTAAGLVTGDVVRVDIVLEGGVRADRLRAIALPDLGDRPLLGMDVLGRLRWEQRSGVLRIDLRPEGAERP
jgi:aspartyl protease family protein